MPIYHRADKNKSKKITAKSVIKSKIDIKAGEMTFNHRIELGKILSGNDSEIVKFQKVFECLHNFTPMFTQYNLLLEYFKQIIEGLAYWIDVESKLLKYEPTAEEKQAGIKELSVKIGELGTIDALAEKYGIDPDEVLKWQYAKVFGILFSDLEKSKYQRKYHEVINKKK